MQGPQHAALSVGQGIAIIFGTNIGAGLLSLPYAARNGGFLSLCLALILAGTLTTICMLFIAEVSLRTKEDMQISALAEKYLGNTGRWCVFAAVIINAIGALTAYASGSGLILHDILKLPAWVGSIAFFALGSYIMYKGLQATGRAEAAVTIGMAVIIFALSAWTLIGPGIALSNLAVFRPYYIVPIMNLAVFSFMAQYVVPELARGLSQSHPKAIPHAIIGGMIAAGFTLALVPFVALGLLGMDVSEVATVAWGEALGPVAYYLANIFAVLAMFTSFMAIGYTAMRNILNVTHWPEHGVSRFWALGLTVLPPLVISALGLSGFADALGYAGGFAGAIMLSIPVFLLRAARRHGDEEPAWQVTWQAHPAIQFLLLVFAIVVLCYSIGMVFDWLPKGW
ncbi:MAG: amino acid permease [Corynebacterium sp.]|nr:amino acid permease [Corynebacterium sp.]